MSLEETDKRVRAIYDTLDKLFARAKEEDRVNGVIADEMAREIIAKGKQ